MVRARVHVRRILATLLALGLWSASLAHAGLGESEASIQTDRARMNARRHVYVKPSFTVQELTQPDGSRVRQFVGSNGVVFAVTWNARSKPDLSSVLGTSYPAYVTAANEAARRHGVQRQFRHDALDLVVQANAHLQVFAGYAYRRSLMPAGLSPERIGLEGAP